MITRPIWLVRTEEPNDPVIFKMSSDGKVCVSIDCNDIERGYGREVDIAGEIDKVFSEIIKSRMLTKKA